MMSHLQQAYHFDIHSRRDMHERLPAQGVVVIAKDVDTGIVYEKDGVKATAFRVDHIKPAFGYRLDFGGRSVVLSGDTGPSENLIHFSQGTHVLILNVIVPDAFRAQAGFLSPEQVERIIPLHTTPEQAGQIFARVKPKLAVYTHLAPGFTSDLIPLTRKTYSGPLEVGEYLMTIDLGEKIQVRRLTSCDS
jgi:ribonuclease Z